MCQQLIKMKTIHSFFFIISIYIVSLATPLLAQNSRQDRFEVMLSGVVENQITHDYSYSSSTFWMNFGREGENDYHYVMPYPDYQYDTKIITNFQ